MLTLVEKIVHADSLIGQGQNIEARNVLLDILRGLRVVGTIAVEHGQVQWKPNTSEIFSANPDGKPVYLAD